MKNINNKKFFNPKSKENRERIEKYNKIMAKYDISDEIETTNSSNKNKSIGGNKLLHQK